MKQANSDKGIIYLATEHKDIITTISVILFSLIMWLSVSGCSSISPSSKGKLPTANIHTGSAISGVAKNNWDASGTPINSANTGTIIQTKIMTSSDKNLPPNNPKNYTLNQMDDGRTEIYINGKWYFDDLTDMDNQKMLRDLVKNDPNVPDWLTNTTKKIPKNSVKASTVLTKSIKNIVNTSSKPKQWTMGKDKNSVAEIYIDGKWHKVGEPWLQQLIINKIKTDPSMPWYIGKDWDTDGIYWDPTAQ